MYFENNARNDAHFPHIAVVIPMYNAERHIKEVLRRIPSLVQSIIVVDDCSRDRSLLTVQSVNDSRIRIVLHSENRGVGGAMKSGYKAAYDLEADIIVKIDSDGQMDPEYIEKFIAPILAGEANYTKGNRFLRIDWLKKMPFSRRIGNLGLSFMTKLASGYWDIFDPTNGYTAIQAEILPLLNGQRIGDRYFFESSMLLELGLLRAVVIDVEIPTIYGDEESNLSGRKALIEFPGKLMKGAFRRLIYLYYLRDFTMVSIWLPVGFLLTVFGSIFGGYHWYLAVTRNFATPVGTVMLSVLPIILGFQFLLQAIVADIQSTPRRPLTIRKRFKTRKSFALFGTESRARPEEDLGE